MYKRQVQAGTEVAEVKGKDLIPAHGLAMSRLLKTSVFSTEALTYEQAIAYLRKEAIVLPPSVPKGYVLVTYKAVSYTHLDVYKRQQHLCSCLLFVKSRFSID